MAKKEKTPYSLSWIADKLEYKYWRLWSAANGHPSASDKDREALEKGKLLVVDAILSEERLAPDVIEEPVEEAIQETLYLFCPNCTALHSQPRKSPLCLCCKIKEREQNKKGGRND